MAEMLVDADRPGARRRNRRPLDGDRRVPGVLRRHEADPQPPARRRGRRRAARRPGARRRTRACCATNADELAALVRRGDVVVLHDPQTAGLAPGLRRRGAIVVLALPHRPRGPPRPPGGGSVGLPAPVGARGARDGLLARPLRPPAVCRGGRVAIVRPAIDPFSPKNQELPDEVMRRDPRPRRARRGPARRDGLRVPPRRRLPGARGPRRRHPAGGPRARRRRPAHRRRSRAGTA